MKKKQGVVFLDDYQQQHQQKMKTGKNKKDVCGIISVVSDEKQLQQVMKAQKQKEKQELQAYRRKRDTEKRRRNMLLLQSRRVKDIQKMGSVKVFDEYEEHYGTFVWKHEGCNTECLQNDCLDWILENINYNY
jgi:hypothetical protein